MISVDDLVKFVEKYRRGKAFLNYTVNQIRVDIIKGISRNACIVDCLPCGMIVGIATGEPAYKYRLMHVRNILTIHPDSLKRLMKRFCELYPNWDIQGYRHDNLTRYKNIKKLKSKIYGRTFSS